MLSPHTKPGTKIICIRDMVRMQGALPIRKGTILTVDCIVPDARESGNFGVIVKEIPVVTKKIGWWPFREEYRFAYRLDGFRVLELPSCLTDLLKIEKLPIRKEDLEN